MPAPTLRLAPHIMALRRRLLQDISELQKHPYPNISLCMQDDNLQSACLFLTPDGKEPLHLSIIFGDSFPLKAPTVTIQSRIKHPNVFGDYICASILNTEEGYTSAYTLKGIAIQLLSFFSSERIEQSYGGRVVELKDYREPAYMRALHGSLRGYTCQKCGFGKEEVETFSEQRYSDRLLGYWKLKQERGVDKPLIVGTDKVSATLDQDNMETDGQGLRLIDRILALPDELLLLILGELDHADLLAAAKVCSKIGEFMNSYDAIRIRELQCFCFKTSFMDTKLGIGVHVERRGRQSSLASEFDFLSKEAFFYWGVRRSIQGLRFEHWLPLPLSRRHWRSAAPDVYISLARLADDAGIQRDSGFRGRVIYNFMNYVVVKLSREAEQSWGGEVKSTLTHASEKAVESYFGLFHLLLCLALEQNHIIRDANRRLESFLGGHTSKQNCPDLGQLLVAVLVSDGGLTQELTLAIIKEAILRNVVWMLDSKGAGMAELSYIEPSAFSDYRLRMTFAASKTSYRLLMFLALFCKTARPPGKPLQVIRDELFDTHGAPPKGTAESMAAEIRKIRTVNSFPVFFEAMGLTEIPSKENFCTFLKKTIEESVRMGYSCEPITQDQALALRSFKDPFVQRAVGVVASLRVPDRGRLNFFPRKGRR
ncbi:MAG: hypothetical protein Q9218_000489 [Villophora microphyllina]